MTTEIYCSSDKNSVFNGETVEGVNNASSLGALFTKTYEESKEITRGEWPSGPASSSSFTEVKHGSVRSEARWATFQMNDQNSSLRRPSEGTAD